MQGVHPACRYLHVRNVPVRREVKDGLMEATNIQEYLPRPACGEKNKRDELLKK